MSGVYLITNFFTVNFFSSTFTVSQLKSELAKQLSHLERKVEGYSSTPYTPLCMFSKLPACFIVHEHTLNREEIML